MHAHMELFQIKTFKIIRYQLDVLRENPDKFTVFVVILNLLGYLNAQARAG